MNKVEGKVGEKVLVSGSYRCTAHDESWFSFNKGDAFRLCPRCRNEHKSKNTWYNVTNTQTNFGVKRTSNFMSIIRSILPL